MFKMLLTTENAKTSKGESLGYLTGILYLSHGKTSGHNLCPKATPGCLESCLDTAGRGAFNSVKQARLKKTQAFFENRNQFLIDLEKSIVSVVRKAKRLGLIPCIRLNGTSDILFEKIPVRDGKNIFGLFPEIQFYDYTAILNRPAVKEMIPNYHLTFSRKETRENHIDAEKALKLGVNVAAVYLDAEKAIAKLPNAVTGDSHDLRFLDPKGGHIIALKAKGKAKKDLSGFVIRNA